jgi:hypothetical protein
MLAAHPPPPFSLSSPTPFYQDGSLSIQIGEEVDLLSARMIHFSFLYAPHLLSPILNLFHPTSCLPGVNVMVHFGVSTRKTPISHFTCGFACQCTCLCQRYSSRGLCEREGEWGGGEWGVNSFNLISSSSTANRGLRFGRNARFERIVCWCETPV